MGKAGGDRNFGFGKQMGWAGYQALRDAYGDGRYATAAAHGERWGQFAAWAKGQGMRDSRDISRDTVTAYGRELTTQVREGTLSLAYAQNLLSSVNVVLEALRGDRQVRGSPSTLVGERNNVRGTSPAGLEREPLRHCTEHLRGLGHPRVAAVVALARDLGLRVREASLLDARGALRQFEQKGAANITEGTKGGRGRQVDRWVPVSEQAAESLRQAAKVQDTGRNLVPEDKTWRQWNDHLHRVWESVRGATAWEGCTTCAQLTPASATNSSPAIRHRRWRERGQPPEMLTVRPGPTLPRNSGMGGPTCLPPT
jgi:hypothetical protein